jgi:hypothetical protein
MRYFPLLLFSALNFAQRAFVAFEIFALAAADIVRLGAPDFRRTTNASVEVSWGPFSAIIAP